MIEIRRYERCGVATFFLENFCAEPRRSLKKFFVGLYYYIRRNRALCIINTRISNYYYWWNK